MKKIFVWIAFFAVVSAVFADDDDIPYLSDFDISSIEATLLDDTPEGLGEISVMRRPLQTDLSSFYNLIILDRIRSANSNLGGIDSSSVLYEFQHGSNGYLVAVYTSSSDENVLLRLPANSRVLVHIKSERINVLREYVNSNAFRRFITNDDVRSQIIEVLNSRL